MQIYFNTLLDRSDVIWKLATELGKTVTLQTIRNTLRADLKQMELDCQADKESRLLVDIASRSFIKMKEALRLVRDVLSTALQERESEKRSMQLNAELMARALRGVGGQQQQQQQRYPVTGGQLREQRSRSASPAGGSRGSVDFKTVCGFWYRHARGQSDNPCKKGMDCDLNHSMPGDPGFDESKRKDSESMGGPSKRSRLGTGR